MNKIKKNTLSALLLGSAFLIPSFVLADDSTSLTEDTTDTNTVIIGDVSDEDNESYSNNTGSSGGLAIRNSNNGETLIVGDNAVFYNNTPTSGYSFFGGAINNATGAIMTIGSDALFDSNQANLGGAAIYNSGTLTIDSGAEFTNNSAPGSTSSGGSGGAINNSTKGTLSIGDDVVFYNNTSSSYGGAIFNQYSITIGDNATFTENKSAGGGAIYAYHASLASSIYLKIGDNATFTANEAISASGGVVFNYGVVEIGDDAEFTGNTACNYGGAIYNYGTSAKTTIGDNATFTGNSATNKYGGAVYNGGSATIAIGDNATFTENSATHGGAVFVYSGSATIGDGAVFADNSAIYAGGAIYNITDTFIIGDSTSTSTYNVSYTGNYVGTYDSDSGSIVMTDASDSDASGGFLYNDGGSVTFDIDANSSITIGDGKAGYDSIAGDGNITKSGTGELVVNSSMEFYEGSLIVDEGTMTVNNILGASTISIGTDDTDASLTMGITDASNTIYGNDTVAAFSNSSLSSITGTGTLSLVATASLADNSTYTVFANGDVSISTDISLKTFGGTLSGSTFTVAVANTSLSLETTEATVEISAGSRVAIATSETDDSTAVYLAFSSTESTSGTLNSVSDESKNSDFITAYTTEEATTENIISGAYYFDFTDLDVDSVLVSLYVGDDSLSVYDFTIYHYDSETGWDTTTDLSNVSYDGEYLSFEVTHFSGYGYSATSTSTTPVPEPSTYALIIGLCSLGFVAYRRRK